MAVKFEYPPGATPLDPDDAAGLIPSHITTQGQLNEWEFQNVAEARAWAFSGRRKEYLTTRFTQELHRRMFGKTWKWAGTLRRKETLPGIDPRNITVELRKLFDDVAHQLQHKSMLLDEIAARFHHHWGNSDLVAPDDTRKRYIAALRAADGRDHSLLFEFVRSGTAMR